MLRTKSKRLAEFQVQLECASSSRRAQIEGFATILWPQLHLLRCTRVNKHDEPHDIYRSRSLLSALFLVAVHGA
jgi:hypothetical protein